MLDVAIEMSEEHNNVDCAKRLNSKAYKFTYLPDAEPIAIIGRGNRHVVDAKNEE